VAARVWYGGTPLEQPHVPRSWADGFVWAETPSGAPWVSVVSVLNGADIWWPTKDHPSDEPDSMAIRVTAPGELEVAANGRLLEVQENGDGTRTHHGFVSDPINNYELTHGEGAYRASLPRRPFHFDEVLPIGPGSPSPHAPRAHRKGGTAGRRAPVRLSGPGGGVGAPVPLQAGGYPGVIRHGC